MATVASILSPKFVVPLTQFLNGGKKSKFSGLGKFPQTKLIPFPRKQTLTFNFQSFLLQVTIHLEMVDVNDVTLIQNNTKSTLHLCCLVILHQKLTWCHLTLEVKSDLAVYFLKNLSLPNLQILQRSEQTNCI